ncbi:MAG: hypothetical protein J5627_02175 [Bacilli bacterium]|nr:hypothetical protein [Bacilli bacterium]
METFVKDTKEIKGASFKESSLHDEILNDRRLMNELHALDIDDSEIDKYLPLLATYLDQRDAEEDPKKEIEAPYPGLTMKLCIDDSGKLSYTLGPSEETKRKEALEKNYIYKDFPESWKDLNGKSIKGERYKKLRTALAKTFTKTCTKPWVFVKGDSGCGKSYYLAAVLNGLAADGESVCFINGAKRFDELKALAIKNRQEFDKIMASLEGCGTMVIDDFGNEFKSEYIRDQIILPLLAERSRAGLRTYFTSQYTLDEIKQLYSLHKSYIEGSRVSKLIEKNIDKVVILEAGLETFAQKRSK